jgi:hypothetical protein
VFVLGPRYVTHNGWGTFDAVIVMIGVLSNWVLPPMGVLDQEDQELSKNVLILRICRLLRLARVVRMFRMFQVLFGKIHRTSAVGLPRCYSAWPWVGPTVQGTPQGESFLVFLHSRPPLYPPLWAPKQCFLV